MLHRLRLRTIASAPLGLHRLYLHRITAKVITLLWARAHSQPCVGMTLRTCWLGPWLCWRNTTIQWIMACTPASWPKNGAAGTWSVLQTPRSDAGSALIPGMRTATHRSLLDEALGHLQRMTALADGVAPATVAQIFALTALDEQSKQFFRSCSSCMQLHC